MAGFFYVIADQKPFLYTNSQNYQISKNKIR